MDQNVYENNYGGSFGLLSTDNKHYYEIGRSVRTNQIDHNVASLHLLKNEIPVTAKNYLLYRYQIDSRDHKDLAKTGDFLNINNELAVGSQTLFYKLDFLYQKFYEIKNDLSFQGSLSSGIILPWDLSKIHINDRFRFNNIKGFKAIGDRTINDRYGYFGVKGDNLGNLSHLNLEAKLNLYTLWRVWNVVPFLYGNLFHLDPIKKFTTKTFGLNQLRGSFGFGIQFNLPIGKIEISSAIYTWKRPGDVSADFQLIFN